MARTCFICKVNKQKEPKRSYHRFPSNEALKQTWLNIIGKGNVTVSKYTLVCSIHFEDSAYNYLPTGKKMLKSDSVPSLFISEYIDSNLQKNDAESYMDNSVDSISIGETKPNIDLCEKFSNDLVENSGVKEEIGVTLENFSNSDCNRQPKKSSSHCRTCLVETGQFESIFATDNYSDSSFAKMIYELTSIQISENSGSTTRICVLCISRLKDAYDFRSQCIRADKVLNSEEENAVQDGAMLSKGNQPSLNDADQLEQLGLIKQEIEAVDIKDENLLLEPTLEIDNKLVIQTMTPPTIKQENLDDNQYGSFDSFLFSNNNSGLKLPQKETSDSKTTSPTVHVCTLCQKQFTLRSSLTRHVSKYCRANPIFRSNDQIKPKKENKFQCQKCPKTYATYHNLNRHVVCHGIFNCKVCNKQFTMRSNFKKHLRTHDNDLFYPCKFCDRSFHRFGTRWLHVKSAHSNELQVEQPKVNLHECQECKRTFQSRCMLSYHRRFAHSDEPVKCAYCDKTFRTYGGWSLHKRTFHSESFKPRKQFSENGSGKFRLLCSYCGKRFQTKQRLETHIRVHTGDRPYKCKICLKGFTQTQHLITHSRVHTGEKPFKCDVCNKLFRYYSSLREHKRKHAGEMLRYKCTLCPKKFFNYASIKKHKELHQECLGNVVIKIEGCD